MISDNYYTGSDYIGYLSFQCQECDTRIDGKFEVAMQMIRFHQSQHKYQNSTIDEFLNDLEGITP